MTDIGTVWGVDVACDHVSLGIYSSDGLMCCASVEIEKKLREGERLARLYDTLLEFFIEKTFTLSPGPPEVIWVELPTGRFPNPPLMQACGVTLAAAFNSMATQSWTITPGTWKKLSVGKGNATKDEVAEWVTSKGWKFDVQDEADAMAIAYAAAQMSYTITTK